ncbi:MAG: type II secretion system F family protein [Deltaproteobacteria bacterium]|nr:MAG: type II secretion system F family protein [Deltaproteobacteria bacterium]
MAVFGYRVTDDRGKVTEGVIEAAGERAARDRLREMRLVPIRVWAASAGVDRRVGSDPSTGIRRPRKDLLPFLQGFRTLLSAGVPIDRALEMMAELFRGGPMGAVAVSLLREVRAGSSLSDAMRKVPGAPFSRFLVQMVQAGQATGRLEEALDQAYRFMERSREFRSNLFGSLLYPAILLVASVVSVILLVVFVVPRFAGVFASSGVLLPLPTRALLAVSSFLSANFVYLLAAALALFGLFRAWIARPEARRNWDRGMMTWPLVGATVTAMETSRVMRSLSSLLSGGVPILPAFVIAREVSGNTAIREGMEAARLRVQGGAKVARALEETTPFPAMALQMIAVGEETGRLEEMLASVADSFEDQAKRSLRNFLTVLEPAVILAMGLLVGFIVFSMFLAIFRLNEVPF